MNLKPSKPLSDRTLDQLFENTGVERFAVTDSGPVSADAMHRFDSWIEEGCHGGMEYLSRHRELRSNPEHLLAGVKSVICCAVPYPSPRSLPPHEAEIAAYALGDDYHDVVREMLSTVATRLKDVYGGETRVCVDTAPLPERYWALRSGLGFKGMNGHLIIPGLGSTFFLGEILTTVHLQPTAPLCEITECEKCGACVKACPAGAIRPDGTVDARKCLSYLTIEHRGEFPEGTNLHGHLYGCDVCSMVCPHNRVESQVKIDRRFQPRRSLLSLTVDQAAEMTQEQFSCLFRKSAIKRTKLAGLRRNAEAIRTQSKSSG